MSKPGTALTVSPGAPRVPGKPWMPGGPLLPGMPAGPGSPCKGEKEYQRALLRPHRAEKSPRALQSSEGTQPRLPLACGGPGEPSDPRRGSYLGSFSASSSGQTLFPGGAGGAWVPPLSYGPRLA